MRGQAHDEATCHAAAGAIRGQAPGDPKHAGEGDTAQTGAGGSRAGTARRELPQLLDSSTDVDSDAGEASRDEGNMDAMRVPSGNPAVFGTEHRTDGQGEGATPENAKGAIRGQAPGDPRRSGSGDTTQAGTGGAQDGAASRDMPPFEEPDTEAGSEADEAPLSECSAASDDSDVFHVEVFRDKTWTTREDVEIERIEALAGSLRQRPLLPPHPEDATRDWTDVASGVRLPRLHCAIAGCPWTGGGTQLPLEEAIGNHLLEAHHALFVHVCGRRAEDWQAEGCDDAERATEGEMCLAYYCAAIREREKAGVPSVGPSVDRRTFGHLAEVYNSDNIRSLICACCAQIHTDTGSGRFNAIGMTSGEDQVFNKLGSLPHGRGEAARRVNFDQEVFTERYATQGPLVNAPELAAESWEWRQLLRLGDDPAVSIICCPEDVQCRYRCQEGAAVAQRPRRLPKSVILRILAFAADLRMRMHYGDTICKHCRVPVCRGCRQKLVENDTPDLGVPMALANDNLWGYGVEEIYEWKVRWIEAAAATPFWTSCTVFYVEEDQGHLMGEQMYQPTYRTASRGNVFSLLMPWEDIIKGLLQTCGDVDLARPPANQGLPHGQEMLSRMVRFHLRISSVDASKHIEHARLRPHVVLKLLHALIDRQHEVFMRTQNGQRVLKAPAALLKQRMAEAVAAKYPEDPADARLPEAQRRGTIPPMVWEAMLRARQEPRRDPAQKSLIFDKNATPAAAPEAVEDVFSWARPYALVEERSSRNVEDINVQHAAALAGYSTLRVQTDSKLQPQWESWYLSSVSPWEIPRMVGGADYWPKKPRWRRTEADAPVVSPFALTKGLPRRAEGQIRSSWTLVPAAYNIYFRWNLLNTGKLSVEQGIRMSRPTENNAMELITAAKGLYQQLWSGSFKSGSRRRAVAGDTTRLSRAEGLTPTQRALVRSLGYMSNHIPGTQQIRVLMGHALFGSRVVYGDPIFMTISPNEKHSALVLRLSRLRRNDPLVTAQGAHREETAGVIGAEQPPLERHTGPGPWSTRAGDAEIELPPFAARRALCARDPLAVVDAFDVNVRVVLSRLLGVRMCPRCPHCNGDSSRAPCQDAFGSNMRPLGGGSLVPWKPSAAPSRTNGPELRTTISMRTWSPPTSTGLWQRLRRSSRRNCCGQRTSTTSTRGRAARSTSTRRSTKRTWRDSRDIVPITQARSTTVSAHCPRT